MNRNQVIENMTSFQNNCRAYIELILSSRDHIRPEIIRNFEQIEQSKTNLNRSYASLERYINKFGNRPILSDGVNPVTYSPYNNAFTSDTLLRVGPSLEAVVDDLNIAIGRVQAASDNDFKNIVKTPDNRPHYEYWGMIFSSYV